jgi:hypothetical protein
MCTWSKQLESGNINRGVLLFTSSVLPRPRALEAPFARPVAGETPTLVWGVYGGGKDDVFSSETTRACENPRTLPGAVSTDAIRCV